MPGKRDLSIAAIKDMSPDERFEASQLLEVGSSDIFTDEEYVGIYNSLYGTSYKTEDRNAEELANPNVKSHLFMYMMTEKGVSPEAITEMTADEVKAYVPDFKKALADHPIYGEDAEKLSKEELENNIKWYGNLYGTAYKQIADEKFPDADELTTEAGITKALHKNSFTHDDTLKCVAYAGRKIDCSKIPLKEGMTEQSTKQLLSTSTIEASGHKSKRPSNSIFYKSQRSIEMSDMLINVIDPDADIRSRAINKVIVEVELAPMLAGKETTFEDNDKTAKEQRERIEKLNELVNDPSKPNPFKDFTDKECQQILSTPLADLKTINPELYGKTVIAAAKRMPIGSSYKLNGMSGEERERQGKAKELAERANKQLNEVYKVFEDISHQGQVNAKFAKWIPEKNGKIDTDHEYFGNELSNNESAFDDIFKGAKEQQSTAIRTKLKAEDKYHLDPSELGVDMKFVEGFMVSDPDNRMVDIPVMDAVEKYLEKKPNDKIRLNKPGFAKMLVMYDIKKGYPVKYDPLVYAEDGAKMGNLVRASEDDLKPVQLHVYDPEKIKSGSAQLAIDHDKQKNVEHVEEHIRKKKEAADYAKIAHELRMKERAYEEEYQRDLKEMEDAREQRKRAALEEIRAKRAEQLKKQEEEEFKNNTININEPPKPEDNEEEMFKEAEEAFQLMLKEQREKERAFKEGNKFCIEKLSDENKQLYDIMDEDLEDLKKAMEAEKLKNPSKNKVNLPHGAENTHGVSKEVWNDLKANRIKLDESRWNSWLGFGTSHELSRLKHQMDRLQKICEMTNERPYDDKYVRLRDEMVQKLEKEAIAYDKEKRGAKHMGDHNWKPFTPAGQKRFAANQAILKFCKDYKNNYACKDEKILSKSNISDKVVDVLDEKQWIERLGDIDPDRKPADPEEQKKVIREIRDCAVGILNAKFSKKFIDKEEISTEAAEMFFDTNSEKIQNANAFKSITTTIKGKDAWEKAMNLKKLAEKSNGDRLIDNYTKIVAANKKAEKKAPEDPENANANVKDNTVNVSPAAKKGVKQK